MSPADWLAILRQQVEQKTQGEVAREIGYSPAVVNQVLRGRYQGDVERVAARVAIIYGKGGKVDCPELGAIDPGRCADTFERAQKIGVRAGNPMTARLYKRCRTCPVRR